MSDSLFTEAALEQLYDDLLAVISPHVKCIEDCDDELYSDYAKARDGKRLKQVFENVAAEAFKNTNKPTAKRMKWPFNSQDKYILTKNFERVYNLLLENRLRPELKASDEKIEAAGGKPYRCTDSKNGAYPDGKYGDIVVEPNIDAIRKEASCSRETVFRLIKKMCKAGILVKLKTAGNKPGLYIIGRWFEYKQPAKTDTQPAVWKPKPWLLINSTEERPAICEGLIDAGLMSERKG